jgi:amino acid transporter
MLYRKNLQSWEQIIRLIAGVAMAVAALRACPGTLLGYGLAAAGVMLALTGIFGFCPACAMVGRRPNNHPPARNG